MNFYKFLQFFNKNKSAAHVQQQHVSSIYSRLFRLFINIGFFGILVYNTHSVIKRYYSNTLFTGSKYGYKCWFYFTKGLMDNIFPVNSLACLSNIVTSCAGLSIPNMHFPILTEKLFLSDSYKN